MQQDQQVLSLRRSFSRLTRFVNQLMREQLACGPVTIQQCHTLEAVAEAPLSMKDLSSEIGLHQSTVTRIVEKLERLGFVTRTRKSDNQRSVEVRITELGAETYARLHAESAGMFHAVLDLIPEEQRAGVVDGLETITELLDPNNEAFRALLECSSGQNAEKGSAA